jgi:hypothetical protein
MTHYKCYLPWRGELGWMLNCFVKMFHADSSTDKIICCKPGHECLFPSASHFFYEWQDILDSQKAGVAQVTDEYIIKQKIIEKFSDKPVYFVPLSAGGWHNKHDYAKYTFIPESKNKLGLKTDIVIAPRNRVVDANRNWTQENWQKVVDGVVESGITVGVCGTAETSFSLDKITCKSYDHIDIDSDVELINNAKLVVVQESGMQYLSFLCQKPTFCIDFYHKDRADLHRNPNIIFKEMKECLDQPEILIKEILSFIKSQNDSNL